MKRALTLVAAASCALLGCGSARREAPLVGAIQLANDQERLGRRLYLRHCDQCHPGGDAGLGPALNNKPLPELAVRTQIRKGVGAMPAFPPEVLDDRSVDAIAKYVERARKSRPE